MTLLLAVLPVVLLVLGFPIFLVLLASAAAFVAFATDLPPTVLHQVMFGGVDSFALLSIPFFLFAGQVMAQGGIAQRIVDWVQAIVGWVPGSLAVTTVGASTVIGAMSGSSAATTATCARLLYDPLIRSGYGRPFATGVIAASGGIDVVIPPSIAMILYGIAAEQSVPRLFAAGVLPGIVIAACMIAYIVARALRQGLRGSGRFDVAALVQATLRCLWALGMPAIIFGGIYGGAFSPTEAAGIACVYAALVAVLVYRDVGWRDLWTIASDSLYLTAQIMVIVAAAGVFAWMLTTGGVPARVVGFIERLDLDAWEILLAVNLLLLAVGCFVDPTSAILVLTPLLLPVVRHVGIDPIHFGIVMTVNLSIGMFTPPFGLNLFVMQSIFRIPVADIYRGVAPFIAVQIVALAIITYVPEISLWATRRF